MYNSENRLWLPSEYRPLHSAVSGDTIGIGVGSAIYGYARLSSKYVKDLGAFMWR